MSDTWNTLLIARDARIEGRDDVAARLLAEVAPDFEYVRSGPRKRLASFEMDDGDPYEDYNEPEPYGVQRRNWALWLWQQRDWLAWTDPLKLSAFDMMLREEYPAERVQQLAMRRTPVYAALSRDGDAIEMRV